MIIVTFTKLFVMSIVARVRSLSSRSVFMLRSLAVFASLTSAISVGERLKNAISDPLANAEKPMSTTVSTAAIITPIVGVTK